MSDSVKISAERTREALEHLGITEDQLKIAKALDREKIKYINGMLNDAREYPESMDCQDSRLALALAQSILPTFDDEVKGE